MLKSSDETFHTSDGRRRDRLIQDIPVGLFQVGESEDFATTLLTVEWYRARRLLIFYLLNLCQVGLQAIIGTFSIIESFLLVFFLGGLLLGDGSKLGRLSLRCPTVAPSLGSLRA